MSAFFILGKRDAPLTAVILHVLSLGLLAASAFGARADDVAGTQAELLQQRLNRLEQIPELSPVNVPGLAPPTTAPVMVGSFPRSFVIPGTDTSLRLGGVVMANVVYWLNGVPTNGALNNGGGNTQTCPDGLAANCALPSLPLDRHGQIVGGQAVGSAPNGHSRSTYFQIDARNSQLFLDTRTQTPYGEVKAYISFDFYASSAGNDTLYSNLTGVSNGWIPRLREAYGTLGGLLVGQTTGSFRDVSSEGDFVSSGDEGYSGRLRAATVRYTWDLPGEMKVAVSANNPVSEGITPDGQIYEDTTPIPTAGQCPVSPAVPSGAGSVVSSATNVACLGTGAEYNPFQNVMPDWIATWRIDRPWGHVQLGGALREITLNDGKYLNQNILGGGGYLSGDWQPFYDAEGPKQLDDLGWGFGGGPGIGSLISDCYAVVSNWGPPASTASNGNGGGAATLAGQNANIRLYDSGTATKTIMCWGAHADALHWWTRQLRTNLTFGITHMGMDTHLIIGPNCITTDATANLNNCGNAGASANAELMLANVNLIWSPASFVDLGVEYTWGHRVTVGSLKGDGHTVSGVLRVKF